MSRDKALAADILLTAKQALIFVQGSTQEQFSKDKKTQAAVLMELVVIGEAVKGLSEEFRPPCRIFLGRRWPECGIG